MTAASIPKRKYNTCRPYSKPVRRGLVSRAEEWPWSSAAWYIGARDVPLVPDAGSIPAFLPT